MTAQVPSTKLALSGWGNYSAENCWLFCPQHGNDIETLLATGRPSSFIARGLGRSYGDSSLNQNEGVVLRTAFNRFLAFDEASGVLDCEAGVSVADIMQCLLPRGWFVPTTPGTKFVTIGGAVAADVHGKNHHCDGSIGTHVLELDLLLAGGTVVRCSPAENSELFWATVGGMGLTGVIVRVRMKLRRVESAYVRVTYKRTANLDETLECFAATDAQFRYSVAWVDCLAGGSSLGRSIAMLANDAAAVDIPLQKRAQRFQVPRRATLNISAWFPSGVLRPLMVRTFNSAYYASHPDGEQVVDYDTFFYPLDSITHWNRVYGRRGFIQYQVLFPPVSSRRALIEILETTACSQQAAFLAVLKTSGPASGGVLSYLFPGHTLAMDFPNTGPALMALIGQLDRIVLKHGGRLYLAKDALMSAEMFTQMYPESTTFRRIKTQVDPAMRFSSSQARRIGLVQAP